jgi:RNA polymerase sigma-70 factor (ECF subfamily)
LRNKPALARWIWALFTATNNLRSVYPQFDAGSVLAGRTAASADVEGDGVTDKTDHNLESANLRHLEMAVNAVSVETWFLREVLPLEAALMGYFGRHWADKNEVRDMVQDVYVRVCEAAEREIPRPTRPFVFTTARNLLIDKFRSRQVIPLETVGDVEELLAVSDQPNPERIVIARDELRRLQAAFAQLAPRSREALLLRRLEGLSRREIAQRMGVGEETVKAYLASGLFNLSDLFFGSDATRST